MKNQILKSGNTQVNVDIFRVSKLNTMSEEYDLNDPIDVEILRGKFDMYTHEEWDEYIELAEERQIGYKNINILKTSLRKAGLAKFVSPKMIKWVLSLIDQLDAEEDEYEDEEE